MGWPSYFPRPLNQKIKAMIKKYKFNAYYTFLPLLVMFILVIIEYTSIAGQQMKFQDIFVTMAFFALMYLSLRCDCCLITKTEFSRRSYFFWKKSVAISNITAITFPSTWIVSPEARTLVVWDKSGQKITMTDMGYTRPVLADVVNTLIKINPSIRLDETAKSLIK